MWKDGRVASESGVVDLVYKNAEEGCSLIVRVLLQVGLDIDDECGGDGGEQTGLSPSSIRVSQSFRRTHEYQSGIQVLVVLFHELLIILLSLLAVVLEETSSVVLLSGQRLLFPVMRI